MSDSPRFFCDVHVSNQAVLQLKNKDVDIIHCGEVGLSDAANEELLVYAVKTKRVMVSCDDDFGAFITYGSSHSANMLALSIFA